MKKILVLLTLLSTVSFGKIQYKYIHKHIDISKELNLTFKELLAQPGITIIDIHFIPFNRYIQECVIVYDDGEK